MSLITLKAVLYFCISSNCSCLPQMSIFLLIINVSRVTNCSSLSYQSGSELDITLQEIILNACKVKEKLNFIIFSSTA